MIGPSDGEMACLGAVVGAMVGLTLFFFVGLSWEIIPLAIIGNMALAVLA